MAPRCAAGQLDLRRLSALRQGNVTATRPGVVRPTLTEPRGARKVQRDPTGGRGLRTEGGRPCDLLDWSSVEDLQQTLHAWCPRAASFSKSWRPTPATPRSTVQRGTYGVSCLGKLFSGFCFLVGGGIAVNTVRVRSELGQSFVFAVGAMIGLVISWVIIDIPKNLREMLDETES